MPLLSHPMKPKKHDETWTALPSWQKRQDKQLKVLNYLLPTIYTYLMSIGSKTLVTKMTRLRFKIKTLLKLVKRTISMILHYKTRKKKLSRYILLNQVDLMFNVDFLLVKVVPLFESKSD